MSSINVPLTPKELNALREADKAVTIATVPAEIARRLINLGLVAAVLGGTGIKPTSEGKLRLMKERT